MTTFGRQFAALSELDMILSVVKTGNFAKFRVFMTLLINTVLSEKALLLRDLDTDFSIKHGFKIKPGCSTEPLRRVGNKTRKITKIGVFHGF